MLGDLQAERQVEGPVHLERPSQVSGHKPIRWDPQLGTIDIIAINSPYLPNTVGQEFSSPRTDTTTYINDTLYR
jgi:hypothetical protein